MVHLHTPWDGMGWDGMEWAALVTQYVNVSVEKHWVTSTVHTMLSQPSERRVSRGMLLQLECERAHKELKPSIAVDCLSQRIGRGTSRHGAVRRRAVPWKWRRVGVATDNTDAGRRTGPWTAVTCRDVPRRILCERTSIRNMPRAIANRPERILRRSIEPPKSLNRVPALIG